MLAAAPSVRLVRTGSVVLVVAAGGCRPPAAVAGSAAAVGCGSHVASAGACKVVGGWAILLPPGSEEHVLLPPGRALCAVCGAGSRGGVATRNRLVCVPLPHGYNIIVYRRLVHVGPQRLGRAWKKPCTLAAC